LQKSTNSLLSKTGFLINKNKDLFSYKQIPAEKAICHYLIIRKTKD